MHKDIWCIYSIEWSLSNLSIKEEKEYNKTYIPKMLNVNLSEYIEEVKSSNSVFPRNKLLYDEWKSIYWWELPQQQ